VCSREEGQEVVDSMFFQALIVGKLVVEVVYLN
jgi:hypothetical protein